MKIFVLFVLYLALVEIIDSKKYRAIIADELSDYELDKHVPRLKTYFDLVPLILEEVEDDQIIIGGHGVSILSMDRNVPLMLSFRSQYYQNSKWHEGFFQLSLADLCKEFTNSERFWYNVTKLWSSCPPQKGDKWFIDNQLLTTVLDLPTLPLVPWRGYMKVFQGMPGFEIHSFGFGIHVELVLV